MTTWNKINKALGTGWTKMSKPALPGTIAGGGSPIGLLLSLTYTTTTISGASWTKITKASGTSWNKITKAT